MQYKKTKPRLDFLEKSNVERTHFWDSVKWFFYLTDLLRSYLIVFSTFTWSFA